VQSYKPRNDSEVESEYERFQKILESAKEVP